MNKTTLLILYYYILIYKKEMFKYLMILAIKMEEESIFLDYVGDSPRMRVMQHLIEGRNFDYTITDMLNAGVSWGTLNQLIPKLLELGLIVKTRKIGRATLYKINNKNAAAKQLIILYNKLIIQNLEALEQKTQILA